MLLLSLDTSTAACSVALHKDGTLLGAYELFTERTSAAMLTTLLEQVVTHSGFALHQVDAIAVAKGPGSYTGLRIGVSTAKGLCFALDKPLLAVNTLVGMAEQIRAHYPANYRLCPMIDARRMEVYCALFDASGRELAPTSAQIIDEHSFGDWLAQSPVVFFGDGAAKCQAILGSTPTAIFPDQLIIPSARTIGKLATVAFEAGQFEDMVTFEPFYLKDFMAIKPKKAIF
ncbi:tRNA (adenosine(37)-N6)-threonylcarbamoyltransferase complex dimerization subunit type 1 TsaB [Spirosoma agri]|uniref:tRNA (Adenosine(37)-N6)-threonylcarbamoyltransferase complex dimerization subunit type 1 TsaB n=1 Tax=Spirosoma agri TaxID=1987381 RepID=A0A6M0IFT3_9BACT|nr:tRNA (adenosine(37)-N6)-threonylcarbamoyltransferase complex dimerization subunit type 1 TsaB [Spirosoma agri]NEU65883.1 tRNA (adenosine(37)-N6)-threonylcarbamoyltransferase complex dimerization subunit type 1 TsaB [Spirosoma agri]